MAANPKEMGAIEKTKVEKIMDGYIPGNKKSETACNTKLEEVADELQQEWSELFSRYLRDHVSYLSEEVMNKKFGDMLREMRHKYIVRRIDRHKDKATDRIFYLQQTIKEWSDNLLKFERIIEELKVKLKTLDENKEAAKTRIIKNENENQEEEQIIPKIDPLSKKNIAIEEKNVDELIHQNEQLRLAIEQQQKEQKLNEERIKLQEEHKVLMAQFELLKQKNESMQKIIDKIDSADNDSSNNQAPKNG